MAPGDLQVSGLSALGGLCLHSFVAGTAAGTADEVVQFDETFIALVAHKGSWLKKAVHRKSVSWPFWFLVGKTSSFAFLLLIFEAFSPSKRPFGEDFDDFLGFLVASKVSQPSQLVL